MDCYVVLGGAFTSAKSVVSSWWSSFNVPQSQEKQDREEISETSPTQEIKMQQPELIKE